MSILKTEIIGKCYNHSTRGSFSSTFFTLMTETAIMMKKDKNLAIQTYFTPQGYTSLR